MITGPTGCAASPGRRNRGSAAQDAPSHGTPEVVARPHLLDEFTLPRVLDVDPGLGARRAGRVGALREMVAPGTVLTHEHDAGTAPADVLDHRRRATVSGGERLEAVHQRAGGGSGGHRV